MQLKSAFRNWQLSREVPPIDQEHIQPTIPNGSSRSSTTTSTDNNDPDAPLQPLPSHRPNPSRILRMYHVCRREVVAYGKPGLKRDLASWTGIMIIGTSFMITLFYMFIFIWQPHSHYSSASHNFISERPITKDGKPVDGLTRWMEDFSRSVIPIMCHSHNDYWRPYPLYSALAAGCTGIEADVWLSDDGTELLVGHDPSELRPEKTLKSMYLDPLLEILNRENPDEQWGNHTVYDRARGIFGTQPNTTVTVLIDVKTDPQKTFELVHAQLEPLRAKQFLYRKQIIHTSPGFREHQDTWPGPLIIVATGNMDRQAYFEYANSRWTPPKNIGPWEEVFPTHWEHHDYFYDAPLGELPSTNKFFEAPDGRGGRTTWANIIHSEGEAYYASVSFNKAIGSVKFGFSTSQLATLREQIRVANKSGLQARYWDLPSWPINYRDYVWDVLTREGVGMLSVDDLESAARRGWSKGYMRNVVWMICVSLWIFGSSVVGLLVVYRMLRKRTEMLLGLEQRRGIYLE